MLENHYMTIPDIYKLPIMDFSLYYTKIVMNINARLKKVKEQQAQHKRKLIK